jgi:pimeloyl-ACP methyl ester carboxylesterase
VLRIIALTVARDDAFRERWDHAGNRAASPSMARAVSRVVTEADVRDALPRISAPTLILHRGRGHFIPATHGRFLADRIAGARYVELSGADSLYWVGEAGLILDEVEEFITGVRGSACRAGAHHDCVHRHRRLDPPRGRAR